MKKKNFKPILVTFCLVMAFAFVIYAMRYVQGGEFQRGLEVFFGAEKARIWRWCPAQAASIEWHQAKDSWKQLTPQDICEVVLEPVPEEKANLQLKRLLTVSSEKSRKTLEADEALEVFKVEGLIFQSQSLSQALKRP